MNPRVTIVIPCYNCERTLGEAFDSCFEQGLRADDFEIVMVDDGSTDRTSFLMKGFASQHPQVRLFFHAKNRGGGAARNTGIREARGSYIYCLDSDNILGPKMLSKMLAFAERNACDGVAVLERRFFSNDKDDYTLITNEILERPLALDDLFSGKAAIMIDNFLYTKPSYEKAGGYPEHHGFDTQAFEIRYLVAGNVIRVCPDTYSYHRIAARHQSSYFEREYNKGNLSLNYFLIAGDMLPVLSDKALRMAIGFDVLSRNSVKDNLFDEMKKLGRSGELFRAPGSAPSDALAAEYRAKLREVGTKENAAQSRTLYRWYHKAPVVSSLVTFYFKWKNSRK